MDIFRNTSAFITKSLKLKKTRKNKKGSPKKGSPKKSSYNRSSKSSKSSYESLRGSPESKLNILKKNISKKYKKIGFDKKTINELSRKIDDLDTLKTLAFKKRPATVKSKSKSPIILTIRNLDTGKKEEATVVKNLNTGKYEFIGLK